MCLLRSPLSEGKKAQWDNFWPMVNKLFASPEAALADIPDGSTIMIGGFGNAGMPAELIDALIAQGARELTIVNNNAGNADTGLAALIAAKRVRKILCSFPRQADSWHFDKAYRAGEIELELVPQGTLAERIRAAGALIKADRADRWGNLVYRKTARNFAPIMAMAAKCTVVQVRETVELGALDPELVATPGIFVQRVIKTAPSLRKAA